MTDPVNNNISSGRTAVCTLFEGHYHFGLGALVNSLYSNGFRDIVWAGYRGALPPWATPLTDGDGFQEFKVGDGLVIRFVAVESAIHLTNFKPQFMLDVFEKYDPEIENLFYFDPDIVIRCQWSFYLDWVSFGITVVADSSNANMTSNHPVRMKWKVHLKGLGIPVTRELNQYFNAGFVGMNRSWMNSLTLWNTLLHSMGESVGLQEFMSGGHRSSAFYAPDQDSFNEMFMSTESPISTIGPEGMDLAHGGFTMSHAIGPPKPWKKKMLLSALKGTPPVMADKYFWAYAKGPIVLFSQRRLSFQKIDNALGAAVGRIMRRG